ncbi:MAG: ATP-binding protein [Planctomyces sp.]|nr:ATP-binding protein [Planctomyces sp.]
MPIDINASGDSLFIDAATGGRTPVVVSWSGGKDSLLALEAVVSQSSAFEVRGLLTTYCGATSRVAIHGTPLSLIRAQAAALGLRLFTVELPENCPNVIYESLLTDAWDSLKGLGISTVVFGDLYLADIRAYREQLCGSMGVTPLFPLWQERTLGIPGRLAGMGYTSVVCSVMSNWLSDEYLGRTLDEDFVHDLPPNVDPAGENGEYHSFVVDGPLFRLPVGFGVRGTRDEGCYRQLDMFPASDQ